MTTIINRLEIDTVKFEDLTAIEPYSYLPTRGSVVLQYPRTVKSGTNINGQNYYVYGSKMATKIISIKSPPGYGIPGSMADALMQFWDIEDILGTPFEVIENYTSYDGSTRTWNKCIMLEEPIFLPLQGEELRYFYSYEMLIAIVEE